MTDVGDISIPEVETAEAARTRPDLTLVTRPAVSVVIPCFNEADRTPALIGALRRWQPPFGSAEVILVDDGSTDGTADLLAAACDDLDLDVTLLRFDQNRGKGAAVRHGVGTAQGSYVVFLDADLSVELDAIAAAISRLDHSGADLAFGSRRHPESDVPDDQPLRRQLGGRLVNMLTRRLGLSSSRDTQCGFKVMRRALAHDVFPRVEDNRFAFDVELLHLAEQRGYETIEVPVRWRHHDGSKVRPVRDGLGMVRALWAIRRRTRPHRP
ncbi:MAG: glycosyltransferase family 2 protein [Acidimicrobiia bacterium]|nr:glycosyltransferase family 2 protein [Acidimicrobiia bacterium]